MFKKDKNEVRVFFNFYYTELDAFAEYLEKQEENGLRLKEISGHSLYFEKCEPRKIRYTAEIFKGWTPRDFIESCCQEGWEYVDTYNRELYIFRTKQADIIDIMTDEKEKIKTVGKRVLSQPGSLAGLGIAFVYLLRFVLTVNDVSGDILFEAEVINYSNLMLVVFFSWFFILRAIDLLLWKIKIGSALRKGEKPHFFNLKNTLMKRRVYSFTASLIYFLIVLVSSWISPEFFIYKWEILVFMLFIVAAYQLCLMSGLHRYDKKQKLKSFVITCVVLLIFAAGLFALQQYNEAVSIENRKSMLSLEEIPVSLSELGIEAESCEDKGYVDATRFAQLYIFSSSAEWTDENENSDGYINYNILISDYPDIRQKYIDSIFEEYERFEYETVKVTSPETGWDYYYRVKYDDENEYNGFAVKDNLIFYMPFSVMMEEADYFEFAYENLFG